MKKLFGLALLALAFLPFPADAATRFWVGGTGTWDASDMTHWAATSGGAGGQSVPGSGDTVTFDGSSGGGTVTVNTTVTVQTITAGAFTGTLAFNTNNNNVTVSSSSATSAVSLGGSGTRTINMGSGTWTFSGGGGFDNGTQTNCTSCVYSNATLVFNGAASARVFAGGGQTYGAVSVGSNSTKGYFSITGTSNTLASFTVADGNTVLLPQGVTTTISGALSITGLSTALSSLQSAAPAVAVATLSVGSASTLDWTAVQRVTKSGAGSITGGNSFDQGGNTSITITGPSAGGGGRIIGG